MTHPMTCPDCGIALVEEEHQNVTLDRCTSCDGLWFDIDEIHRFLRSQPGASATNIPAEFEFRSGTRGLGEVCPSCAQHTIEYGNLRGIGYRGCTWCGGLFLETHQIQQILRSRPGEITCSGIALGSHHLSTGGSESLQRADLLLGAADLIEAGLLEGAANLAEGALTALLEFVAEAIFGALL